MSGFCKSGKVSFPFTESGSDKIRVSPFYVGQGRSAASDHSAAAFPGSFNLLCHDSIRTSSPTHTDHDAAPTP